MSLHIKRLAAPRSWAIPRKTGGVFVVKPRPGPHAEDASLPLGIVLRDVLRVVGSMSEASRVIHERSILVDGKPAASYKQGVGFMDLVQIPPLEQNHRVLLDRHGRLTLVPTEHDGWKLCRIENKTSVKGGKLQLNLHDGRNVIVKEDLYKTGDVVKVKLPEGKIVSHYKLAEGAPAMIIGGKHAGQIVRIQKAETTKAAGSNLVEVKAGESVFTTIMPYVFVVGTDRPEITLPGAI